MDTKPKTIRDVDVVGATRWYAPPTVKDEPPPPPAQQLVSSAIVAHLGVHDHVRLWTRGGFSGEIVVCEGDGALLMTALGLVEKHYRERVRRQP